MTYDNCQLLMYLHERREKVKEYKTEIKRIVKQKNEYKKKLNDVIDFLNGVEYQYDKYDNPSDYESGVLSGRIELKNDLLRIIKR